MGLQHGHHDHLSWHLRESCAITTKSSFTQLVSQKLFLVAVAVLVITIMTTNTTL